LPEDPCNGRLVYVWINFTEPLYLSSMWFCCLTQALKKFMAVSKHYFDIEEDQFDFHSYCIRKMTLRAYIEMLRMVRTLSDLTTTRNITAVSMSSSMLM
jgi:NMDA receptor-regulated protein 1